MKNTLKRLALSLAFAALAGGSAMAQSHLRMKYDYLQKKGWVHSTEEFIERAGTQSSLSSEPYQVQCPNHPPVKSADWLTDQLRQRRMAHQDRKP